MSHTYLHFALTNIVQTFYLINRYISDIHIWVIISEVIYCVFLDQDLGQEKEKETEKEQAEQITDKMCSNKIIHCLEILQTYNSKNL